MNVNQFHNLEHAVGTRFLEYVLNYPTGLARHTQLEEYAFTRAQIDGAGRLLGLLAMSYSASPGFELISFSTLVHEFNDVRRSCGGGFPKLTETNDRLLQHLRHRLIEGYPLLLLRDKGSVQDFGDGGYLRFTSTKRETELIAALLDEDAVLKTLLNNEESVFMRQISYTLENSIRVQCPVMSFSSDFLLSVFAACCYRGKYGLIDVLKEVESALRVLRDIASGKEVVVSFFRGIYGLRLDAGKSVDLGGGTIIRNIDDPGNPLMQGTMSTGATTERQGIQLGCVLEHRVSSAVVAIEEGSNSWTVSLGRFEELVDCFVMAIILSGQHGRAPVDKTFAEVYVPLYRHFPSVTRNPGGGITCINSNEIDSIKSWFNLLSTTELDHVRIPLSRIRAALFERMNPVDALIDFFIAWESMFSHKLSTTNSVVRSMEAMLERANKSISRGRLGELYGLRSEIVHGATDEKAHDELQTPQAREGVRDEVCEVALIVLSELLKDTELLELTPQQRVMRLLSPSTVKRECDGLKF